MSKIRTHLVLGGARSGKTRFAENLALATAKNLNQVPIYIATAQALDMEMEKKIQKHQKDRGNSFITKECPLDLSTAILSASATDVLLIDCLTLFVTNLLCLDYFDESKINGLVEAVKISQAQLVIVSNETGLGIIPDNNLARKFRDVAGTLNQNIASLSDCVTMMIAGIAVPIKP
mgnify:CR=1 FL=1